MERPRKIEKNNNNEITVNILEVAKPRIKLSIRNSDS